MNYHFTTCSTKWVGKKNVQKKSNKLHLWHYIFSFSSLKFYSLFIFPSIFVWRLYFFAISQLFFSPIILWFGNERHSCFPLFFIKLHRRKLSLLPKTLKRFSKRFRRPLVMLWWEFAPCYINDCSRRGNLIKLTFFTSFSNPPFVHVFDVIEF